MVDVGLVFQKMLMLLVMMCVGFAAGKAKVMTIESNHWLSVLINNVTMPCTLLYAAICGEHEMRGGEVAAMLGVFLLSFLVTIVLAKLFRLAVQPAQEEAGIYELLLIIPNSAYIGMPVATAIFGSIAVFCLSMYNLPYSFVLYCYGVGLLRGVPLKKLEWKQMLSPVLIASLVGAALYLCNVRLPKLITEPMQAIGQISTPGAMMLVGSTLSAMPAKGVFRNWRLLLFTIVKLLLLPVVTHLIFSCFVQDRLLLGIVTLVAAMPTASMTNILAAQYQTGEELTAAGVFLTTICSVLTIPLVVMLLL